MNVSFGICVGENTTYLHDCVESIHNQSWVDSDNYEIILVGDTSKLSDYNDCILIDSSGWLPEKKNLIAKTAKHDILVILHDYYRLPRHYLYEFESHGLDWDLVVHPVVTLEGKRSADWIINPFIMDAAINRYPELQYILRNAAPHENGPRYVSSMPYDVIDMQEFHYVSGGYIVCKRDALLNVPMNESLKPGDPEDVLWSQDMINKGYLPVLQEIEPLEIMKPNKWAVAEMPNEAIDIMRDFYAEINNLRS